MAKKPRAAKSNKLGLKNKAKTAARRAAKVKARPSKKAAGKTKSKPASAKRPADKKAAGLSRKHSSKPAPSKAAPKANKMAEVSAEELENRLLFSLAKTETPAAPEIAEKDPKAPTENFFHSKAKALRDQNARYSQHAHDHKHGGFNARLPGAQKGRRGK